MYVGLRVLIFLLAVVESAAKRGKRGPPSSSWDDESLRCSDYKGDVVFDWNRVALDANVRNHNGPDIPGNQFSSTMGPPASAVHLAKVHAAIFDAYNSIAKQYEPMYIMVEDIFTMSASIEAAVTEAAYRTLSASFPSQVDYFDRHRDKWLRMISDKSARDLGIEVGSACADAVLTNRLNDGSEVNMTYDWPGPHEPDPNHPEQNVISPQAGSITPFMIKKAIRSNPPPEMKTNAYLKAYDQVKELGGDNITTPTTRTMLDTVIAWYWSYNGSPNMGTPPRLCNEIARVVACKMNNDIAENARLFALVNCGLADAGISAWDTKFHYNWWRPIVGIRKGDSDGNQKTQGDPEWNYLGASRSNPVTDGESNFSPPFPAYTSGHATFCAVVFKTLANFYGTNDMDVIFKSQEWDGETLDDKGLTRPCLVQTFPTLSLMSAQCAASRVFNGVHWAYDGTEGVITGNAIADYVYSTKLKPLGSNAKLSTVNNVDVTAEINGILEHTVKPDIQLCKTNKDLDEELWSYLSTYQSM